MSNTSENPSRPDPTRIIELASAFYDSCTLFAASDAGIFGALAATPDATATQLAEQLAMDPRGLRLLLDGCVSLGLLEKMLPGETYRNTPEAGAFLVPGGRGDLSGAIRYNRDVYPAWGNLLELAKTGKPVESPSLHLGDDAARTRTFVQAMHSRCLAIGQAAVGVLRPMLAGAKAIFDPAGGPGTYACLLAKALPDATCITLDLPAVSAIAEEIIAEMGCANRVTARAGDYHTAAFPADQDVVTFFGCLHQESPEAIVALLKKARAALRPGGRVCVLDMMTDETRTAPKFSSLFAVNMALTTQNGWVFSDADLEDWLTQAGFAKPTITPLPAPMTHWLAVAQAV